MTGHDQHSQSEQKQGREPIFLLPTTVAVLAGVMIVVHIASTLVLNQSGLLQLYYWFAYLPARFIAAGEDLIYAAPLLWTPITHAFLHGGWDHLVLNTAWLLIFGTPVARRYGGMGMIAIFVVSAIAGAALFTVVTLYDGVFLIGASGGVAGLTGAAIRFMFQPVVVANDPETGERIILGRRLASIKEVMLHPRARFFTLLWVILNAAVPLLPLFLGVNLTIAWQAHLGGFLAGFFMVQLFERRA
ncbi:rhomboid family intramembrane serine protease [Devosia sp. MC521]|uniref:rhomboid family intramembrane serine protease n=1 Tax=Devosia sp. MC521 TaxID=2759954 RepID=UPI0015FD59AE|nr:rhomboid family intramembrane serine protease [Devosia sp. MC521]MBJ6986113.1 rhomboid family intramembrane serine protease [Devosia sp. MC521]QMW61481.1 rhomboid family intramembrane serine protease [Devosia sp. MC521]